MPQSPEILSVSEITKQIKLTLEEEFSQISVVGEISNFKAHVSGHWYFNLKDSDAVISCTMWKGLNSYVFFRPEDGMKVIVSGKLSVYPPRGSYQIDVRSMKPAGIGELQAAFERLKRKLQAEGLFEEEHKKPVPIMPQKIGIVTGIGAAAFRDMISVAERRFPLVEIIIAPAQVQGNGASATIVKAIKLLNTRKDIDVIIVGRGGGSIEDLWAFNEEEVARAIYNSRIPVVTGIGHEIDFTIADFVADLRAPTPSAAMELVTPDKADFFAFINEFSYNSTQKMFELLKYYKDEISSLLNSYGFRMPLDLVRRKSQQTDYLLYKLMQNVDRIMMSERNKLALLSQSIESHDVEKTLKRGFVIVKQNSKLIKRAKDFDEGVSVTLQFYDNNVTLNKNNS